MTEHIEAKKEEIAETVIMPGDPLRAKMIAEKLKRGRQRAAAAKGEENQKVAVFSRYISILTVGETKDINSFMDYTVYQLYDEFERFELKQNSDVYLQARLAGAQDLEEVDNWMKDIHP